MNIDETTVLKNIQFFVIFRFTFMNDTVHKHKLIVIVDFYM